MNIGRDLQTDHIFPKARVELKFGIERRHFILEAGEDPGGGIRYANELLELVVRRRELPDGWGYSLRLRSLTTKSIRLTRLRLPIEGGLSAFLGDYDSRQVSFLRNGYQSWSTVRSYRISDRPLRPRLGLVSLATSNMANLPSNIPGMLSSEMYSIITDLRTGNSLLVGQTPPFDQFFYINLNIERGSGRSFFELTWDFGRQMVEPHRAFDLDGIVFIEGTRPEVEQSYFHGIRESTGYVPPEKNLRGWCSWYQYYDRITPEIMYRNIKALKERGLGFDFFQIDDGYQTAVGDWLEEKPAWKGRMKEMADAIRAAGMRPGIWLAPFSCAARSEIFKMHPEYVLRNEYGKVLDAGYNPVWKGMYHGLDITHPRFAEYLREVIRTMVQDWGFEYLKCDFLFSACLRGANHHELDLSRSMILKKGMSIIREEAGPEATIIGCGMPLSSGIGLVDAMRVGPDTGDFWTKFAGRLLRMGSMVGARNSIRNFTVRSPMHKRLWLNDPDCVMIRDTDTGLSPAERLTQMDAIALSGGLLMYSDDFSTLSERAFADLALIDKVSSDCFDGRAIAVDVMWNEIPEIYLNTSGYVGFFNYGWRRTKRYDLRILATYQPGLRALVDVRSGERIPVGKELVLENMPRHGSRLFRIERMV